MKRMTRYLALVVFLGVLVFGRAEVFAGLGADCAAWCDCCYAASNCPEQPSELWMQCVAGCIVSNCGYDNYPCWDEANSDAANWCFGE